MDIFYGLWITNASNVSRTSRNHFSTCRYFIIVVKKHFGDLEFQVDTYQKLKDCFYANCPLLQAAIDRMTADISSLEQTRSMDIANSCFQETSFEKMGYVEIARDDWK